MKQFVQCSAPSQIGYDNHTLIGFDDNGNAVVDEGYDTLELKLYFRMENKTESYGFYLNGVWYEFGRSIKI